MNIWLKEKRPDSHCPNLVIVGRVKGLLLPGLTFRGSVSVDYLSLIKVN